MSAPEPGPVTAKPATAHRARHAVRIAVVMALLITGGGVAAGVLTRAADSSPSTTQAGMTPTTIELDSSTDRAVDSSADRAVDRLEAALRTADRGAFLRGWTRDPAARAQARELFHNLTALNARVELSVVGVSAGEAAVEVRWRLRGIDQGMASTTLAVELSRDVDRVRVSGVEQAADSRQPIWMLGRLTVRRDSGTVTAATDPAIARQVEPLLEQAKRDVRAVDRGWRGSLVAYVPDDQSDFDSMVGADPGQYDTIAGVTASVDGSWADGSPQMIAINPAIFSTLSDDGRRVLVTHEATHLATNAANSRAPDWLIEGFADYVAIKAAGIPTHLVTDPAVARLKGVGMPLELPSDADFSERNAVQQEAYALSWLAVRMLAQRYGERRLVSFYRDALAQPERLDHALRSRLSTSLDDVTRQWRLMVRELARAA